MSSQKVAKAPSNDVCLLTLGFTRPWLYGMFVCLYNFGNAIATFNLLFDGCKHAYTHLHKQVKSKSKRTCTTCSQSPQVLNLICTRSHTRM